MANSSLHSPKATPLTAPALPRWLARWIGDGADSQSQSFDGVKLESTAGEGGACVQATIGDAKAMAPEQFKNQVRGAYVRIERLLASLGRPWGWRYWNFIPDIHQPCGDCCDRYMIFNSGRYEAIERLGAPASPARCAASAVGYDGADLIIAALGAAQPPIAVENPRQVPAIQYSPKYGPMPPSFARGSLVYREGRPWLLGAGTASVVGEDSRHPDDLNGQLEETLRNIAALIHAAIGRRGATALEAGAGDALACCLEARVYLRHAADEAAVVERLRRAMVNLKEVEVVRAEICRRELLVEIEPLARF